MRLYRLLLLLYPASFRREFGAELRQAFATRRREASGVGGLAMLWMETVPEVMGNAAAVHWDILRQDLRFARRSLSRSWGFAITAVLVSALGVGATAAAFSVTDFVLVRPLPFAHPDRLVNVWCSLADYDRLQFSPANFDDWAQMDRSYSSMAAYTGFAANLSGTEMPERVQGTWTTYNLLATLGVKPVYGRDFTAADDRSGAPGTVMISYAFWQSHFGGDRGALGRSIRLDGEEYQIIGVMPADFQYPSRDIQVWAPFRFDRASGNYTDRTNIWLNAVARLRPGVTLEQARADARRISGRLAQQFPVANKGLGGTADFVRDDMSQQSRVLLLVLSGAALCMLFIACANLGNLLLVRGVARGRELAVRTALGAGRERLVRQMLTETLLLVGLGCAGGVVAGVAGVPLLARLVPNDLPVAGVPSVDVRVLLFACALTLATSLAFALVPAWRATRRTGLTALRDGRGASGGRSERVRALLVSFEVAASVVLLVCTGLLLRTIVRIGDVDPGFRTSGVLTLRTSLAYPQYAPVAARERFYHQVLDGVKEIPGVTSAAYVSWLPLTWGGGIWPAEIPGQPVNRGASGSASIRYVTPGYFSTLGIALRAGRDVNDHDTQRSPYVAVVSASFANRYWPDGTALGHHFKMAFDDREIVGVVADVKVRGLDRRSEPQVYFPSTQVGDSSLSFYAPKDLAIATALPASAIVPAVRAVVRAADPEQPITSVQTIDQLLASQTASRAAQLRVLAVLAVLAVLLAGVGIHGLLAFAVSLRAQEIGVRMALGARSGAVVGMVLRRGLWLAAVGAIPGVAISYFAARTMRSILFGVVPSDPLTIGGAVALVIAMTLVGSWAPARRAARIDPLRVLRSE
jgi:putative ABC transport system permease protein